MTEDVKNLKAAYLAIRDRVNPPATTQEKWDACQAYRNMKLAQEALYSEAIEQTSNLYHVKPDHQDRITIGEPDEQDKKYMTGLSALWNPQVTESGPALKFSTRINGSDGRPHFSGTTEMDPTKSGGRQAVTLTDGRVFILEDTFQLALKKVGLLAAVIYHETRHFNRLSWTDENGNNRSWATTDKEERDAYKAEARIGKAIFGLSDAEVGAIRAQYQTFADGVKNGVTIVDDHLTPKQEAVWQDHYEHLQLNLDEEYASLQKTVAEEKERQLAAQKLEQEERERLERERLEQERAERERLAQEKQQARAKLAAEAGRCGYTLTTVNRYDDTVIGMDGVGLHSFGPDPGTPPTTQDLRIIFLMTRACDAIQHNYKQDVCNDSAQTLSARVSSPVFNAELNHMLGFTPGPDRFKGASGTGVCIEFLLANATKISDARSFEKVVEAWHKQKIKNDREYNERWHSSPPPEQKPSGGGSNPPAGNDNDYIYDPGCSCWIRRH